MLKEELEITNKPLDEKELNEELEPFGFEYKLNQNIFTSIMYPWQREYGYCRSYDEASTFLGMIFDCEPIYFKYDNRNWLIEFWKGQYGMTTGCEIGIYVSNDKNEGFYNFMNEIIYESVDDNERLSMSFKLKKNDSIIITRSDYHWWLTGFKLGDFSKPSKLIMDIEITFKNLEMRDAFIIGLKKTGYKDKNIKLLNNIVFLTFDKPYSNQPFTRNALITFFVQKYNKRNCKLYNSVTKDYVNSLDKINYIRSKFPILYSQLINFGRPEHLFKAYRPTSKKDN